MLHIMLFLCHALLLHAITPTHITAKSQSSPPTTQATPSTQATKHTQATPPIKSIESAELDAKALLQQALAAGLQPMPNDINPHQQAYITKHNLASSYKPKPTSIQLELGKKLYFDPRLSASQMLSCNSCHNLASGGTNLIATSYGNVWHTNQQHLNTPSIYNLLFSRAIFWDGRGENLSTSLQEHAMDTSGLASNAKEVLARIASNTDYIDEFKAAYGNNVSITFPLIMDTIALFVLDLTTPNRFDDFLQENLKALSKEEQAGLAVFLKKGCASCHNGINMGGGMAKFPSKAPYEFRHIGGFNGANGFIKAPSLRNILHTPPYFHNGAYAHIADAIKAMGYTQLGIVLSDEEVESIITFFHALNGAYPTITYPILPPPTISLPTSSKHTQKSPTSR